MISQLETWAQQQSFPVRVLAREAAGMSDTIIDALEKVRNGHLDGLKLVRPPIAQWLKFYRTSSTLCSGLLFTMDSEITVEDSKIMAEKMRHPLSTLAHGSPKEKAEFIQEFNSKEGRDKLSKDEKEFDAMQATEAHSWVRGDHDDSKPADDAFKTSPELQFFLGVTIPCFLCHGIHPTLLLRKARSGNFKALNQLLEIDLSVLHDSQIAELIHQTFAVPGSPLARSIRNSIHRTSSSHKLSRKQVKIKIHSLIQYVSKWTNKPVTAPSMQKYNDAVARDSGPVLRDLDLPESHETYAKALVREQKRQQIVPKLDKT